MVRSIAVVGAVSAIALAPTVASHAARVRPSQHFVGTVNGNHDNAFVYVVCPGPEWPGRTGPPSGNQYLATILVPSGGGFTGSDATSIVASFTDDPSTAVVLRQYGVARPVPADLALPCSGTGSVSFVPMPATAAGGATPDTVQVTYENIAV